MSDKKDGGPAFPIFEYGGNKRLYKGLTIRDYFAGEIIKSIIQRSSNQSWEEVSKIAYTASDAMLAERDKCENKRGQ